MASSGFYVLVGRSGPRPFVSLGEAVGAFLSEEGPAYVLFLPTRGIVLSRGLLR